MYSSFTDHKVIYFAYSPKTPLSFSGLPPALQRGFFLRPRGHALLRNPLPRQEGLPLRWLQQTNHWWVLACWSPHLLASRTDKLLFNMKAASLPDERTDLVSTNRLGHGWAYQKLANQQAVYQKLANQQAVYQKLANQQAVFWGGCDWLRA